MLTHPIHGLQCPRREEAMTDVSNYTKTDEWRADDTCSYCGSLNPLAFIKFLRDGGTVTPTGKNYKVYLESTPELSAPALKFYFQHLDDVGKTEFISLLNGKVFKIGYPGHFYVDPFFATREPQV